MSFVLYSTVDARRDELATVGFLNLTSTFNVNRLGLLDCLRAASSLLHLTHTPSLPN